MGSVLDRINEVHRVIINNDFQGAIGDRIRVDSDFFYTVNYYFGNVKQKSMSEIRTVPKTIDYNYSGPDINHFLVAGTPVDYTYHMATRHGDLLKLSIRTPNKHFKLARGPVEFGRKSINTVNNLYWQQNVIKTRLGCVQSKPDIQKALICIVPDFQSKIDNEENVTEKRIQDTDIPEESLFVATGSSGSIEYKGQSALKQHVCLGTGLLLLLYRL